MICLRRSLSRLCSNRNLKNDSCNRFTNDESLKVLKVAMEFQVRKDSRVANSENLDLRSNPQPFHLNSSLRWPVRECRSSTLLSTVVRDHRGCRYRMLPRKPPQLFIISNQVLRSVLTVETDSFKGPRL